MLKDQVRWVEFECPIEVTAPSTPMDDYDAWVGEPAPMLPGDDHE